MKSTVVAAFAVLAALLACKREKATPSAEPAQSAAAPAAAAPGASASGKKDDQGGW